MHNWKHLTINMHVNLTHFSLKLTCVKQTKISLINWGDDAGGGD